MDYGQAEKDWYGARIANGGQSKKQVCKADVMPMVCILRENGTVRGEKGKTMRICGNCARFEECLVDEDCGIFVKKSMTNADRIRVMTDEELAEWLGYIGDAYYERHGWLKEEIDNE